MVEVKSRLNHGPPLNSLHELAMADNRTEILVRIGAIIHGLGVTKNTHQLEEDTGLLGKGVGLDSVEILQLVAAIEEEFEMTIDDDELVPDHFRSVGNLITFVVERL